jgi:broad specificity phosphatase PhoE
LLAGAYLSSITRLAYPQRAGLLESLRREKHSKIGHEAVMIYLIRHGEPAAAWGGHPNPGLTALGARQAAEVAQTLARAGAKRSVVSPLQRCRETAAPFEKLMETHARIDPGVGEVITPPEIEDRAAWLKGIVAGSWSGLGLQFDVWRDGVVSAVSQIEDETAVFSHFIAINVLVGHLSGDDRVVIFRPAHCSITKIDMRGGKLQLVELGSEAASVVM